MSLLGSRDLSDQVLLRYSHSQSDLASSTLSDQYPSLVLSLWSVSLPAFLPLLQSQTKKNQMLEVWTFYINILLIPFCHLLGVVQNIQVGLCFHKRREEDLAKCGSELSAIKQV